jgi:hypothetical protein
MWRIKRSARGLPSDFSNAKAAPGTQLLAFFKGLGDAKTGRALHIRLSMGTVGRKIAIGG